MMADLQDIWGARAGRGKRDALVSPLLPQRTGKSIQICESPEGTA